MVITIKMVQELRYLTELGIAPCKKALVDANGDMNKAKELLAIRYPKCMSCGEIINKHLLFGVVENLKYCSHCQLVETNDNKRFSFPVVESAIIEPVVNVSALLGSINMTSPIIVEKHQYSRRPKLPEHGTEIDSLRHIPVVSLATSFIDNVFRDRVIPKRGSIVHCSLFGVEHTGIYIGNGKIVDLDGNGNIEIRTPKQFIDGTSAISIYVACKNSNPLYKEIIAERAEKMIGRTRDYHLTLDNCHRFTNYCLTGDYKNENLFNNFIDVNKSIVSVYNINTNNEFTWRAWEQENDTLEFKV